VAPQPQIIEKEVERFVDRIVTKEVPFKVTKYEEIERIVERHRETVVEVRVEVERIVEVEVPYEKIITIENHVEKIIYKDVPVPVQMSNERIVVKEIPVPVEVIREVPVPVERVVYKEVLVPTESMQMGESQRMYLSQTGQSSQQGMVYSSPSHSTHSYQQYDPVQMQSMYGSTQGGGQRVGLGLVLERLDKGITIKDLIPGLGAFKSGQLQQGDVLVSVDGRSVEGFDLDQIKTLTIGDEGSSAELSVSRAGNPVTVILSRTRA